MKRIAVLILSAVVTCSLQAANFSFTGSFAEDDSVQLFTFVLETPTAVILRTWSYAGGTNAAGQVISRGGFDPILAVFDASGNLIGENDDGLGVPIDLSGEAFDTLFGLSLNPGTYTTSVMQYNNFAIGPSLLNGFTRQGQGDFTSSDVFAPGCGSVVRFCEVVESGQYRARDGHWAFDVLNVSSAVAIPELATLSMVGVALVLAALWRHVRNYSCNCASRDRTLLYTGLRFRLRPDSVLLRDWAR